AVEGVLPVPTGTLKATIGNIVIEGLTPNTVQVTYTDDKGIDVSSIGIGDIQILDPASNPLTIVSAVVDIASNGSPRTVTYTFTPPANSKAGWDPSDPTGTYTINLVDGEISDIDAPVHTNLGATLGTFKVAIPYTYTVINNNDAGVGTGSSGDLRYCITQANL